MSPKRRPKPKKKASKRPKASGAAPIGPRGIDFGCPPLALALGGFEFPGYLHEAAIVGVAYGQAHSPEVSRMLPTISLVAREAQPLAKAFALFNEWAKLTDGDSLDLTIIFRKEGGYLLGLATEPHRLERRCMGFDRALRTEQQTAIWCKPIDTLHPFLKQFQGYSRRYVAPFLLDGVASSGPLIGSKASPSAAFSPPVERIRDLVPLLKFQANVIDEADVQIGTLAWAVLTTASPRKRKVAPSPRSKRVASEIAKRRVTSLRTHFPVTLERMRRSQELQQLATVLVRAGVRPWQIEQAICALTLRAGRETATGSDDSTLWRSLSQRFEKADGGCLPAVGYDTLVAQIIANANVLLEGLGHSTVGTLPAVRAALLSVRALEARTAIATLEWPA